MFFIVSIFSLDEAKFASITCLFGQQKTPLEIGADFAVDIIQIISARVRKRIYELFLLRTMLILNLAMMTSIAYYIMSFSGAIQEQRHANMNRKEKIIVQY